MQIITSYDKYSSIKITKSDETRVKLMSVEWPKIFSLKHRVKAKKGYLLEEDMQYPFSLKNPTWNSRDKNKILLQII